MGDINIKINHIVNHFFNGNNSDFAKKLGTSEANIRNYREKTTPKFDFIEKLFEKLPEINPEWLLTGKGSMLKSEDCNNIQEDETSNNVDYKEKYINIIEENRELRIDIINKEKQIQELKETTEKLKEKIDFFQKEAIKSKELKNRSKVPPVKLPNSPECVQ